MNALNLAQFTGHTPAIQNAGAIISEYIREQKGFAAQIISPNKFKNSYLETAARAETVLVELLAELRASQAREAEMAAALTKAANGFQLLASNIALHIPYGSHLVTLAKDGEEQARALLAKKGGAA